MLVATLAWCLVALLLFVSLYLLFKGRKTTTIPGAANYRHILSPTAFERRVNQVCAQTEHIESV